MLSKGSILMIDLLTNISYRLRLPNDSEIKKTLTSVNFYEGSKKYAKFILGKIEEQNTKVSVDFRNPKITIEHIMPQTLSVSWEKELGENYDEIHKTYLHNIGNLILTEFNSEIGNKTFKEKQEKLSTSSLNYRLDIIKRDIWNEQSIIEHQSNMITWFLDTFPLADQFKEKAFWNTSTLEKTRFSPLDSDAGEVAEGNKPIEIHINGEVIKVKTWQDVFIEFLKYLKDSPNFDFDFILENQLECIGWDEVIIKWSSLKELIDSDDRLSNRYKTFDGKIWDKVKELDDDILFIHINISASCCMTRISNVMDKLSIATNSVLIELK